MLEKNIDHFLQEGENSQLYHWTPRQQNNRIIAQQSVFLFGSYKFDADEECIIAKKSKKIILTELEQVAGITEAMLFPDFDGFARLRSHEIRYTQLLDYEYRELADEQFQNEEYKKSIASYDWAIYLNSDYADAYYRRGLAKYHDEQYESAISDFDMFIEKDPGYAEAHYYRADANFFLNHFDEVEADLQTALQLTDDAELINNIESLLYEINSRIVGGSEDE